MIRISLAAARVNKKLSQRKMAEKLGVHEMTYAAWERNPEKIKVEMAEKISGITGNTDRKSCIFSQSGRKRRGMTG